MQILTNSLVMIQRVRIQTARIIFGTNMHAIRGLTADWNQKVS